MRRQASLYRLQNLTVWVIVGLLGLMPESLALRLGRLMGLVAGSLLRVRRRDVDRHLEWAFPDRAPAWRRRVARASYAHLGRESVVVFRRGGWSEERVLERTALDGFDAFRQATEAGRGVILLTGHLGNWEIGGAAVVARGVPLDVIGKGMANPEFEGMLFAGRERLGMRVIEMGEASRGALRTLGEGRVLALLGDQHAHRGGVSLPFFGRPASTVRGPALFAARTGSPVWVAFALRDPGRHQRYTVTFRPLSFVPSGDSETDVRTLMGAYGSLLEEAIRAAPEQYFWQHRRWKDHPPEEPDSEQ